MVDATRPHRVRTVEDVDGEGTRVGEDAVAAGRDTVLPLSGALAVSLLEGLGAGPRTLLVGGVSDLVYLDVMNGYLREGGRRGLDPAWRVLPTGGLAGLPLLAALLGAPLEAAVLLEVGPATPASGPWPTRGWSCRAAARPDRADRRERGRPRGPVRRGLLPAPAGRDRGRRGARPGRAGRRGVGRPAGRAGHRRRRRPLPPGQVPPQPAAAPAAGHRPRAPAPLRQAVRHPGRAVAWRPCRPLTRC